MNFCWQKMLCLYCLVVLASSCGSKKDFIITDDYVSHEAGGKPVRAEGEKYRLSDSDRKYFASKLDVDPLQINNDYLYAHIKAHEGKRFSSGSAAVASKLYDNVYGKQINGTPTDMVSDKRLDLFKSMESLKEGDLIFFRTSNNEVVTHVGVYLKNGRFYSSQNNKAGIFDLRKSEWKNKFVSAGRLKQ